MFGPVFGMRKQTDIAMTDIDFRRLASLLFALKLLGTSEDPVKEAARLADRLLTECQRFES